MNDPFVEPLFGYLPYMEPFIEPFFAFFINPFPDFDDITDPFADPVWAFSLWIQVGWSYALFAFMARYAPFVVAGFLIAFYLPRRKRVLGRQMLVGAAYGSWIGFLVGLTYDAIIMTVLQIWKYMTPSGCRIYAAANPTFHVAPIFRVTNPSPGDTCLSLAGETVLFFLVFVVIGMGVYYLVGQRRGTRTQVRLIKGAVYGLLAAGLLMPVIIQFDRYVL